MDIIAAIAEELQIKKGQAEAAVKLIVRETPFLLLPDTERRQPAH